MFLFYFHTWSLTSSHEGADAFSFFIQVVRNLFWKIFPLFDQILITCLKRSRVFFSFLL